uniref:Uncharacterized protein n=1 Tax=Nicotiana tabacum TaxID=4097 RepID=A0A1S4BCY6_TOBAC|nr:PREDICTED: uncharacterized protein LOC107806969 [Nicotiana tabacum]
MVRSCGRGDISKGRGESSRGRGKGTHPLGVQSKPITKKPTTRRGRATEPLESSSYAPSREASEGYSMEVQPEAQGSDVGSEGSEPSSTPTPSALVAIDVVDDDVPYDGRGGTLKWAALRGRKKGNMGGSVRELDSLQQVSGIIAPEPSVVDSEAAAEPSTAPMPSITAGPSTGTAAVPPPSSSKPSVAVPVPASSTYPLTALTIVAHSSTPVAPQVPLSVEETLKKILNNQKTIIDTLVAYGGVIEELTK